ncbi:hypothetical protein [Sphingopyxis sp. PET50]|uniref:hypothetical protein n=1 Tax=Sphingopyxis sp. PET50 TaxID=2976533 RepID=UPI0021AE61E7|nr:hypothetical protein [Sphingopyxis sp. PET50]
MAIRKDCYRRRAVPRGAALFRCSAPTGQSWARSGRRKRCDSPRAAGSGRRTSCSAATGRGRWAISHALVELARRWLGLLRCRQRLFIDSAFLAIEEAGALQALGKRLERIVGSGTDERHGFVAAHTAARRGGKGGGSAGFGLARGSGCDGLPFRILSLFVEFPGIGFAQGATAAEGKNKCDPDRDQQHRSTAGDLPGKTAIARRFFGGHRLPGRIGDRRGSRFVERAA